MDETLTIRLSEAEKNAWPGAAAEARETVADGLLICPWDLTEHHPRVRDLVRKYADQPMDLADACLVAMSEQWWDCKVITVDVGDFRVFVGADGTRFHYSLRTLNRMGLIINHSAHRHNLSYA